VGAHGGVWECPDLFQLEHKGKKHWVLIVNINPGGPNGGSATQYFIGSFDGKNFTPSDTATRWLDYGPDEYAGITYENTGNRKIFLGWMSNWMYAQDVPTQPWRSATTIPRDLHLREANGKLFVASTPSAELNAISGKPVLLSNVAATNGIQLSQKWGGLSVPCRIDLRMEQLEQTTLTFSNNLGEELIVGYDKEKNNYYIDRSKSGKVDFHKEFAAKHWAPRLAATGSSNMTLVVDVASIELFADNGLSVMTEVFFPQKPYTQLHLKSGIISQIKYTPLKRTWK
jgi:fructan beta-fructosidase